MAGRRFILAGILAAAATGCVFDAGDGGDGDRGRDVPADGEVQGGCGGLPDCDVVRAGCGAASAGLCFPCCAWDWNGLQPTEACCPGADAAQDVPPSDEGPGDVPPSCDGLPDCDLVLASCDAGSAGQCVACCTWDWNGQVPGMACCPGVDVVQDVVADVHEVRDAPPDCGPVTCYDCECDCGDGKTVPYGGCYDDCNPVPEAIANCSMDCTGICGGQPPRDCFVEGIPGDCPEGEACIRPPCEKCGARPPARCLPAPCEPLGCWLDAHCTDGQACFGEDVWGARMGYCAPPPARAGDCWTDAECPEDARCEGAMHCPPCAICDALETTGRCVATAGHEAVLLWVPDTLVLPREEFTPVWFNFSATVVFLPGCSTFTMEKQDGASGAWVDQGDPVSCAWEGIAVRLGPGEARETLRLTAPDLSGPEGQQRWRLHGRYWTGCQEDLPLSQAACTGGPFDVLSREYSVMIPM